MSVASIAADSAALAVTTASLYFLTRQKPTEYPYQKASFIAAYLLFDILFLSFLVSNVTADTLILQVYSVVAPTCVLWAVVFLTFAAYTVYEKPGGKGTGGRLKSTFGRLPHGPVLLAFFVFVLVTDAYAVVYRPFTLVNLTALDGVVVRYPAFNSAFLYASFFVLAFFAYPTALLFREAQRTKSPSTRTALVIFPLCWLGIGATLLYFQGYLITQGYDLVGVGHIVISILIGVTALIFSRGSVLSTFYDPMVVDRSAPQGAEEVQALDVFAPILLMVDPAISFEKFLAKVARGKVAAGNLVYVFTSKGSPLHYAMTGMPGVRFYLMTDGVSYPGPTERSNELLVPQGDTAVILDLMDKTISTARRAAITIIFDSISDLVLYLGPETTYKFLKEGQQLMVPPNLTSIYLLTIGAQDERTLNLVKSLFRLHALLDPEGFRVTKGEDADFGVQGS